MMMMAMYREGTVIVLLRDTILAKTEYRIVIVFVRDSFRYVFVCEKD